MRYFSQLALMAGLLTLANFAQASFVVAELDPENAVASIGSHIIIAGAGDEAKTLWLKAAHTQAQVFRDRAPHGPIRLIVSVDESQVGNYLQIVGQLGYKNVSLIDEVFNAARLGAMLKAQKLIASIDFIGHNGAFLGLGLQSLNAKHRFYVDDLEPLRGKLRFSKDAYIRLLGCNTGWYLAPYFARKLGVPTAGTLTSADVEMLGSDGNWYFDEAGLWPRSLKRATSNGLSFGKAEECQGVAGCVRLKTINQSYTGHHGVYAGALPFMKFFCGGVDRSDCFRRMALSTRTLVGVNSMTGSTAAPGMPSFDKFVATVADQMCPSTSTRGHTPCVSAVTKHLRGEELLPATWTTLGEDVPKLTCDFKMCYFTVGRDERGSSILLSNEPSESTAFVDELNAYRAGYDLLSR